LVAPHLTVVSGKGRINGTLMSQMTLIDADLFRFYPR
jgi:hypothetical protein